MPLEPQDVMIAAHHAWAHLDRMYTLDAGVKREMCFILNCNPAELQAALTDDVIEMIFE